MARAGLKKVNVREQIAYRPRQDGSGRCSRPVLSRLSGEIRGGAGPPGASEKETTKVPIGLRLAADIVESLKASGPGYNTRVEEALRKAGFGAAKKKPATKKAATKRAAPAKKRA